MTNTTLTGPLGALRDNSAPLTPAVLRAHFGPFAAEPFDLALAEDLDTARELAELIGERLPAAAELELLEHDLATTKEELPLALHLAIKLARSRALVRAHRGPLFLSVVFAVYKEHERILTSAEHPHGEDFLDRKLAQLEWLLDGREQADFELVVVDDGCPEDSGGAVVDKAASLGERGSRVRVLKLADAIAAGSPVTTGLASPDDSRKGGSVVLGMWDSIQTERPGHVVIFTDADLSTHLGQSGLLAAPILAGGAAAIGSRRHPDSVVLKGGARNDRGKLFIYLWKGMLAPLGAITDTQCGFKAFDAGVLPAILPDMLERQFAFDIELLLRVALERGADSIERSPIAWFDSEALSTTTDIQPYLPMLKKAAAMYRRYLDPSPAADAVAALIEDLDEPRWQALLEVIPEAITSRDPREFSDWRGVTPAELAALA